ncbi:proteasome subunit alpha type-1-like [Anopheles stephensi]|uniref:proteasome subunit alpha type-1-like n=1 Tax=Anopheles stephensi TaxID=30069 RepID=UPI0016587E47|nr:proteasome subunit alpha type-1-like [Anopheles stephensi]
MFRNQYDSDVTVWSPQGRLHQVEYAMEAVKLGSATVGLKNKEYAVLIALKRASSELSSYQKKIISIDDHLGLSFAGITADARILSRYLRQECLNYKYSYDAYYPVGRLISNLGNKMQVCTQRYDRRPYGVGLLVIGYDDQGPHIYQTCPSANFFDCKAMSIGSRSQSARTYLEKHLATFPDCTKDELIRHGVQALQDTLPNEVELNNKNISIAIVGKGENFHVLDEQENDKYLSNIVRRGGAAAEAAVSGQPPRDDGDDQPPNVPADPIPVVAMET